MKRLYLISWHHNALKYLVLFIFHLSFFVVPIQAQDAFYIYRNDGEFDGFFFDQVVRMGYSKSDLDGVEHSIYVVQEIQTRDSLYRIPLAAIDSIGFQQPEMKLSAKLRKMDELGQTAWFDHLEEDGTAVRLFFRSGLPAELTPKVGEVLAGFDAETYGADGYIGKVASVSEVGGQTVCDMVPIDSWGDIFDRFIGVEQVGYDKGGNLVRRVAGCNPDGTPRSRSDVRRNEDGNFDVTLISWSGRLQYDEDGPKGSNINVGVDVKLEAKLNITYYATSERFYLKATANENFSATPSAHINWSGDKEKNFPTPLAFPAIKFPAMVPIFETDPWPEGFVKIGGSVDLGITFPTLQLPFAQTIILDTESGKLINMKWGNGSEESANKVLADKWFDTGTTDVNLVLNGFLQAGSKVKFEIATNRWIENLFFASIGWEIYSGPKLEGELNFSTRGLVENGAYGLLKDSRIGMSMLSIDTEAKAKIYVYGADPVEKTFWSDNLKFGSSDWYLFPNFDDTSVTYDKEHATVTATVSPQRQTFWLSDVGIGLYDAWNVRHDEAFKGEDYGLNNTYNEFIHTFSVADLPSGKYKTVPLLKTCGIVLPATDKSAEVEIVNNEFTVSQTKFTLGLEAASVTAEITTNAESWTVTPSTNWITAYSEGTTIKISVTASDSGVRTGIVKVTATFKDGTKQEVSIEILQLGSNDEPVVTCTPEAINVEAGGGSETVQLSTNTDELTCATAETWIHPVLTGTTLTVDVDANLGASGRTGSVIVTAKIGSKETMALLRVQQGGLISLSNYRLNYVPDGGTQQVTVTLGGNYSYTATTEADWLTLSCNGNIVDVIAEPNYEMQERTATVAFTVLVGSDKYTETLTVAQKPYIALTPNVLNVKKEGGIFSVQVETSLTNIDIQAVNYWVGLAISSDRRVLTVSVEPNTTSEERTGKGLISGRTAGGITISVSITVNQEAGDGEGDITLDVWNEELVFDPVNAWNQYIMYNCSTEDVTFTASASWVHVVKDEGTFGPEWNPMSRATVSVDNYTSDTGSNRTATITVTAGGSVTRTVKVIQRSASSMAPTLYVTDSHTFDYMDDPVELPLDAKYCTSISTHDDESWISSQIVGDAVRISVKDNMKKEERTGTVTVTGSNTNGSVERTITVTQSAYAGYTVNAEFDGVTILIEGADYEFQNYLPKSSYKHEGVYGTSLVSGNVVVDKKHEASFTSAFTSTGSMGGDPSWNINFVINEKSEIVSGSVSYQDNTRNVAVSDDMTVPSPIALSLSVNNVPPEEYGFYYALQYYEANVGYKKHPHMVWRIPFTPGGENVGVSSFTYQDGVKVDNSAETPVVTPVMRHEKPCAIYIYLHRKGDEWLALPYGYTE